MFSCTTSWLLQLFQLQLVQLGRLKYPRTELVGTAFKLRQRIRNSLSCAHILHTTLNLVIPCCFLAATAKKFTKICNAREGRCYSFITCFIDVLCNPINIADFNWGYGWKITTINSTLQVWNEICGSFEVTEKLFSYMAVCISLSDLILSKW